jgi:hypothetical protein
MTEEERNNFIAERIASNPNSFQTNNDLGTYIKTSVQECKYFNYKNIKDLTPSSSKLKATFDFNMANELLALHNLDISKELIKGCVENTIDSVVGGASLVEDGLHAIYINKEFTGEIYTKSGTVHREDGPAITSILGIRYFYYGNEAKDLEELNNKQWQESCKLKTIK